MPRFFQQDLHKGVLQLTEENSKHIAKSLRMKVGDEIELCDGNGTEAVGVISSVSEVVSVEIEQLTKTQNEPSVKLCLYQALPKSDKMEFIIEKAVELGVSRIVPVLTARCISRPDQKSAAKKAERWNKIAKAAAEQSMRGIIPSVTPIMNFKEAVEESVKNSLSLLFYEKNGEKISSFVKEPFPHAISVFIGSEGGFEESEVLFANEKGVKIATLGKRILRCETAPVCAASIIMNITGNI